MLYAKLIFVLEEINIRNLGVIEQASLEFSPGLNVITGETGAGKTMVLTGLGLLLGKKLLLALFAMVRTPHLLKVAGMFRITALSKLLKILEQY